MSKRTVADMDVWMAKRHPDQLSLSVALKAQKREEEKFIWQPEVKKELGLGQNSGEIDGMPNFTNADKFSSLYREQCRISEYRQQILEMEEQEKAEKEMVDKLLQDSILRQSFLNYVDKRSQPKDLKRENNLIF